MQKKPIHKKLILAAATVRHLSVAELARVEGGEAGHSHAGTCGSSCRHDD